MTRGRDALARARLGIVSPAEIDISHPIEETRKTALLAYMQRCGWGRLPPILVAHCPERFNPILDGHHRVLAAIESDIDPIPAWIVSKTGFRRLLRQHYDGGMPRYLSDLDRLILCGKKTYHQLGHRSRRR